MLLGFIAYWNVAPNGVTYTRYFTHPHSSPFVSDLTPGDRVQDRTLLVHDPVYLHVHPPRAFSFAVVTLSGARLEGMRMGVQVGQERGVAAMVGAAVTSSSTPVYVLPLAQATRDTEGRYTFVFSFDALVQPEVEALEVRFTNHL